MSIIGVQNLKEIETQEGCYKVIKYLCNYVQRKMLGKLNNFQEWISQEILKQFPSILICEIVAIYVIWKIYKLGRN